VLTSPTEPAPPTRIWGTTGRLAGGLVAHNEEAHIEPALRSLLEQKLPDGVVWSRIWVVASGCTDRTVERARKLAAQHPEVEVLDEPTRQGKAHAISQIFSRAEGDALVLLNSDAVAHPGAVKALWSKARAHSPPLAVMGRPVVGSEVQGDWGESLRWMWEMHHQVHTQILSDGKGAHLSDELLLLSLPVPTRLDEGIINDGSFLAVWLAQHHGGCWYAPESHVTVDVPDSISDHLTQRRRIHVGNAQVRRLLGTAPTTLPRFVLDQPVRALRWLISVVRRPGASRHVLRIAFWELVAQGLAGWDRVPPARDHTRWRRIRTNPEAPAEPTAQPAELADPSVDVVGRIRTVLSIARDFETGVALEHLTDLLPPSGPVSASDLAQWLGGREDLAQVQKGRAYFPGESVHGLDARHQLGEQYRRAARDLIHGRLRLLRRWIRCIGISGSVAYGEPEPGDDLDFFVVTRSGALWWVLALTHLLLRTERWAGRDRERPPLCFNYVLDDTAVREDFEDSRGFLFAREALQVQVLEGDAYYRGLLAGAPWMGAEIPRLYTQRTQSPGDCRPSRASFVIRIGNALAFGILAPYLQIAGIWRNHRLKCEGRWEDLFRTRSGLHRLTFASNRFESLRERQERPTSPLSQGAAPRRALNVQR
jgi:glycosyltransferase involved in cell wall biosynthesis